MFRHSMSKCLDSATATKDTCNNQLKLIAKNKLANVILPYYAIDKEIKNGQFKVIEEIVDVKDGYQVIVTKDKNTLVPIIKFLNFISS